MWFIDAGDGKNAFGFQLVDLGRGTVRASPELIGTFFDRLVIPAFGTDLKGRFVTVESHPVPGRSDRAWVIFLVDLEDFSGENAPYPLPIPWHSRIRDDHGRSRGLMVAVGQISFGDASVVGPFRVNTRMWDFYGVFGFRLGVVSPDGDIHLPRLRITADLRVFELEKTHEGLQGFWQDGHGFYPVFDFQVHYPDGRLLPLHPRREEILRFREFGGERGFLVWGDMREHLALWVIVEDMRKKRGHLEMIDVRGGSVLWRLDGINPVSAVALPDGRWAVARRGGENYDPFLEEMDVVIGNRGAEPVIWQRTMVPLGLLTPFPISDRRWVLTTLTGFAIVSGQEIERHERLPAHAILHVTGTLVTDDRTQLFLIPEEETPLRQVREKSVEMTAGAILKCGELFAVKSDVNRVAVLLPSRRVIKQRVAGKTHWFPLAVGKNGYVYAEREGECSSRLVFTDERGDQIGTARLNSFLPDQIGHILFIAGFFVVVASKEPDYLPKENRTTQVLLESYTPSGERISWLRLKGPSGGAFVKRVDEEEGMFELVIGNKYEGRQTFRVTVLESGDLVSHGFSGFSGSSRPRRRMIEEP